jgi:hypothetical protein
MAAFVSEALRGWLGSGHNNGLMHTQGSERFSGQPKVTQLDMARSGQWPRAVQYHSHSVSKH